MLVMMLPFALHHLTSFNIRFGGNKVAKCLFRMSHKDEICILFASSGVGRFSFSLYIH